MFICFYNIKNIQLLSPDLYQPIKNLFDLRLLFSDQSQNIGTPG